MPATLTRPGSSDDYGPHRIQFGAILEKLRRGGHEALTPHERIFVVELFRIAAVTADERIHRMRHEISASHLDYCLRLPSIPQPGDL